MAKAQVSPEFAKFLGRNSNAIEEAKKAENTMSSTPVPIGWEGQCILIEAKADQSKESKKADGTKKGGNPYVLLKYSIVGDEKYQGKMFTVIFTFNDTANATAVLRYSWFLNQMESQGLPREIREADGPINDILDWVLDSEQVFSCNCVEDSYSNDGRRMVVRSSGTSVDTSDSMVPQTTPQGIEEGGTVKFLGKEWKVVAKDGDDLQIERDGKTREVTVSQVS